MRAKSRRTGDENPQQDPEGQPMSPSDRPATGFEDVAAYMATVGARARIAARLLARADTCLLYTSRYV